MSPRFGRYRLALAVVVLAVSGGPLSSAAARGQIRPQETARADYLAWRLSTTYHVILVGYSRSDSGAWRSLTELEWTAAAVEQIASAVGGAARFRQLVGGPVRIVRWPVAGLRAFAPPGQLAMMGDVVLTDYHFENGRPYAFYLTAHEFGHVLDTRRAGRLAQDLTRALGARRCRPHDPPDACPFDVSWAAEPPPGHPQEPYARHAPEEYWAEVFATYCVPEYYAERASNHSLGPRTRAFVTAALQGRE